ncbi:hypothetical protein Tsubulata_010855 [Turnera subulata]|uniref:Cysteine proteinase inhibitor n=1 Tax=Turnera subulata TaxID=218843 RepID=A0A9Q0FQA7_9ROSI|nr:hypothetical protein Tsubulata_010855 [Turnera subulata]
MDLCCSFNRMALNASTSILVKKYHCNKGLARGANAINFSNYTNNNFGKKKISNSITVHCNLIPNSTAKPKVSPVEFLLDSFKSDYQPWHQYAGFEIELDVGDSPHIIRPWRGALDDPEITSAAGFAIDEHNKSEVNSIQFVRVVKACYRASGHEYFLTSEAVDVHTGKKNTYRAIVVGNEQNTMKVIDFYLLHSDPEKNPSNLYTRKEEEKNRPQVEGSKQGSENVDDQSDLMIGRIFHLQEPLDDPKIKALANFAVEEHNKLEGKQLDFVRVVEGNYQAGKDRVYYMTLEVDDAGERVFGLAKVSLTKEDVMQFYFLRLVGDNQVTFEIPHIG